MAGRGVPESEWCQGVFIRRRGRNYAFEMQEVNHEPGGIRTMSGGCAAYVVVGSGL